MPSRNPLKYLPAKFRKAAYGLYAAAVVVTGALAVAGVGTGKTADVLVYLGGVLGITAASNVGVPVAPRSEDGSVDPGSAALGFIAGSVIVYLILR